jgi:hypothetical protein
LIEIDHEQLSTWSQDSGQLRCYRKLLGKLPIVKSECANDRIEFVVFEGKAGLGRGTNKPYVGGSVSSSHSLELCRSSASLYRTEAGFRVLQRGQ